MAKKPFIFTVQGKLSFPLDMLRYDCCYPLTPDDVGKIHASLDPEDRSATHDITLVSDRGPPTADRWASFSYPITRIRRA